MPEDIQIAESLLISDIETLKVLFDPLRRQLLEILGTTGTCTVKALAERVEMPATKLYYHVNLLEKHGLIKVVETRIVSGILEKTYAIAAQSFQIDRKLLAIEPEAGGEGQVPVVDMILSAIQEEIRRGLDAGVIQTSPDAPDRDRLLMARVCSTLSPERAAEFYARFTALMQEFSNSEHEASAPGDRVYSLAIALYPTTYAEPSKEDEDPA